jgi:hypothetical protein
MGAYEFSAIICNVQNILSINFNFMVKFTKFARAVVSWTSRYYFDMLPICIETILINEMF